MDIICTEGMHIFCLIVYLFYLVKTQVTNLSVKCEYDTLYIQCSSGLVIQIKKANFGRLNKDICTPSNVTNCASSTSASIAASLCDNLEACSLQATVSVFGDACPGVDKYLFVSYSCIEPVTTESSSIAATVNTTVTNPLTTTSVEHQQTQPNQETSSMATPTTDLVSQISSVGQDTTDYDEQTLLSTSINDNLIQNGGETANSDNQIPDEYQETTADVSAQSCSCTCDSENIKNTTYVSPKEPRTPVNGSGNVEISDLILDKKTLSSAIRKRISASDDRSSATLFGYIGVAVLVTVFSFLLTLDLLTIVLPKRRQHCGRHRFN